MTERTGTPKGSDESESTRSEVTYRFGDFALQVDRGTLTHAGQRVQLRPKAYAVLLHLIKNHGRLVLRNELLDSVWGETVVTDDAVSQCLMDIRKAIDDTDKTTVRTVPRRGFIFDAPLEVISDSHGAHSAHCGVATAHRHTSPGLAVIFVLGVVLSGVFLWLLLTGASNNIAPIEGTTHPARPGPSIAVLPFADLSAARDQEYFADGMADEILSRLSHVQGLTVIARTSSFFFKNKNTTIAEIANSLRVSHLLQGSVRTSAQKIRVSAQLIDATTSEQIWSETFDKELSGILSVQDEISAAVIERLERSFSEQLSRAISIDSDDPATLAYLAASIGDFDRVGSCDRYILPSPH